MTVTGGETGTATYQWQISANGSTGWTNIAGATGSTYTPTEADETHYLRVQAVFTDGIGETVTATSTPTAAVLDAAPTVTTPTITGTAQEGQTLTASATAGQSDNAVTYAWYSSADGYTNPIGSGADLRGPGGRRGRHDRGRGHRHQRQRRHDERHQRGDRRGARCRADGDHADDHRHGAQEGQTLTASASAGQSDNPVTYAWYSSADSYTNPIGTAPTYLVKEGDESVTIEVMATATNDNGVNDLARPARRPRRCSMRRRRSPRPTITGTAQEGQTLTASASAGQSDNPVTYQWQLGRRSTSPAPRGATYVGQGRRRGPHARGGGHRHQRQRRHRLRDQRGDRGGARCGADGDHARRSPARRRKARR